MPQLKITGKKELIPIDEEQAKELAKMKWGEKGGKPIASPKDPVSLDGKACFSVGDIKNIFYENKVSYSTNANYSETLNEIKARREEIKKWTPLEKAERMLRTYCYLLYRARKNKGKADKIMFQDPLYSKLMKPILEYFEENTDEHYCPRDVYQEFIPTQSNTLKSKISGWKSIGEVVN